MSPINKTKSPDNKKSGHRNYMGGISYDVNNPLLRLRLAASSSFFGEPKYYLDSGEKNPAKRTRANTNKLSPEEITYLREHLNAIDPQDWRGLKPAELMERCIDEALDFDAEATLKYASELRQRENFRATPQVILVRAAHHSKVRGTGLVRKYAAEIIQRADEPATGLAYQLHKYGSESAIPNSLKRSWAKALESFSEYNLAKYKMNSRAVKTVDVVNLVHAKSDAINKLMNGQLQITDKTWEAIISAEGSNKESWTKALSVMGHMALLRNCRNLLLNNVGPGLFCEKLVAGAADGKQLPFRYYSAYRALPEDAPLKLLSAIEDCISITLNNLPKFAGKTACLCDNSGSAQGNTTSSMGTVKVSTIANLTGCLAALRSDVGFVGIFGDKLKMNEIKPGRSLFKTLDKLEEEAKNIGLSTENGIWLFFKNALDKKEHWDNIMVMSDMQAGHGGLYGTRAEDYKQYQWKGRYIDVAKLIETYRKQVNPNVMVYLVQVAGYTDTLAPEFYDKTFILSGWGEGIFRFAQEMSALAHTATRVNEQQ